MRIRITKITATLVATLALAFGATNAFATQPVSAMSRQTLEANYKQVVKSYRAALRANVKQRQAIKSLRVRNKALSENGVILKSMVDALSLNLTDARNEIQTITTQITTIETQLSSAQTALNQSIITQIGATSDEWGILRALCDRFPSSCSVYQSDTYVSYTFDNL